MLSVILKCSIHCCKAMAGQPSLLYTAPTGLAFQIQFQFCFGMQALKGRNITGVGVALPVLD